MERGAPLQVGMEGARPALVDAVAAFLIEQRQALRAGRASADAATAAAHLGSTVAAGKDTAASSLSARMSSSIHARRILLGNTLPAAYMSVACIPDLAPQPSIQTYCQNHCFS